MAVGHETDGDIASVQTYLSQLRTSVSIAPPVTRSGRQSRALELRRFIRDTEEKLERLLATRTELAKYRSKKIASITR